MTATKTYTFEDLQRAARKVMEGRNALADTRGTRFEGKYRRLLANAEAHEAKVLCAFIARSAA